MNASVDIITSAPQTFAQARNACASGRMNQTIDITYRQKTHAQAASPRQKRLLGDHPRGAYD
ncbi:MAG TPA: hypothetical protein VIL86_11040 [Tepidisphaeraceae bacterium]